MLASAARWAASAAAAASAARWAASDAAVCASAAAAAAIAASRARCSASSSPASAAAAASAARRSASLAASAAAASSCKPIRFCPSCCLSCHRGLRFHAERLLMLLRLPRFPLLVGSLLPLRLRLARRSSFRGRRCRRPLVGQLRNAAYRRPLPPRPSSAAASAAARASLGSCTVTRMALEQLFVVSDSPDTASTQAP